MNKIVIACILLLGTHKSSSTSFECSYKINERFDSVGYIYACILEDDPGITTEESAILTSINGIHRINQTDSNVVGFQARRKTINFFPKNLSNFFKNLKAIDIGNCKLNEIHQEDLKPFPKLVHLYLGYNKIEVLEQNLFAFNPDLEYISCTNSPIIHIDSNVFDNLSKLNHFSFMNVPCSGSQFSTSKDEIKEIIHYVKFKCYNSDFKKLEEEIKELESDAEKLNFEDFKKKLESFEEHFVSSKFARFRPLKTKFEELKNLQNSSIDISTTTESPSTSHPINCTQNSSLESNAKEFWNLTLTKLDDIQESNCGTKDSFTILYSSQNSLKSSINDVKISQNEVKFLVANLQSSIISLTSFQSGFNSTFTSFQETQKTQIATVISTLKSNFNSLNDLTINSQDDIKTSLSDIDANFSDMKSFQNDVKSNLNKLKTAQNEVKVSLNEIKATKCEGYGESGSVADIETLKAEIGDKFEKELANARHKISIEMDKQIKGVEKRLTKKLEDFEEKLMQIVLKIKTEN